MKSEEEIREALKRLDIVSKNEEYEKGEQR